MTLIGYVPNRKGGYDVRTLEGKRGEIKKRGAKWQTVIRRDVSPTVLSRVSAFVADLNG